MRVNYQNLTVESGRLNLKLCFAPSVLGNNTNKWLYSMSINLITPWYEFVKPFLRNICPIDEMSKIRSEINQLYSSGWWWTLLIILNIYIKKFISLMTWRCHREWTFSNYLSKFRLHFQNSIWDHVSRSIRKIKGVWKVVEELSKKTMKWESNNKISITSHPLSKIRIHAIGSSINIKAKMTASMHSLHGSTWSQQPAQVTQVNQVFGSNFRHCQVPAHFYVSTLLKSKLKLDNEQVNNKN